MGLFETSILQEAVEESSPQKTPILKEEGLDSSPKYYTLLGYSGRTTLWREKCGLAPRKRSTERSLLM
jgi:hypothetical protein